MKLRVWHNCLIVAELDLPDDYKPDKADYKVAILPHYCDEGLIGDDDDHVSIDPWAKLAGSHVDRVSQPFSGTKKAPPTERA